MSELTKAEKQVVQDEAEATVRDDARLAEEAKPEEAAKAKAKAKSDEAALFATLPAQTQAVILQQRKDKAK